IASECSGGAGASFLSEVIGIRKMRLHSHGEVFAFGPFFRGCSGLEGFGGIDLPVVAMHCVHGKNRGCETHRATHEVAAVHTEPLCISGAPFANQVLDVLLLFAAEEGFPRWTRPELESESQLP